MTDTALTTGTFDYSGLDAEARIVVQQRTGEIKSLMRRTASDIVEVGQKLIEVKERLEAPAVPDAIGLSCADLALADVQSLMVNQAVAGWAASYIARLLISHDLDVYATYFDLVAGSARSLAITQEVSTP